MERSEFVSLAETGGRRLDAFRAHAAGRGAGILILHDMFGVTAPFRALAEDYARRGHPALVPNQFWRAEPAGELPYEGGHERAWARLERFDFAAAIEGMRLAIAALRGAPDCNGKVLALGFCFSGRLAFLAATRTDVDAAAAFYALGISKDAHEAPRCPLQLHYGLADEHVPQSEVDAVAAALQGRPDVDLYRYRDAGHSFFNPVRPSYDAEASALASGRIDALIARL